MVTTSPHACRTSFRGLVDSCALQVKSWGLQVKFGALSWCSNELSKASCTWPTCQGRFKHANPGRCSPAMGEGKH